ncbi:hypothetical protein C4N9_20905 [Pararhodobacter marinus]|uniref:Arc-like DNA binding domain-containing protein n=1 Tax=Pararhodobacter marinus TaxID=2184063 RepID=A0A2U2C4F3_9RHOB|nr:hypothetical protein [Pararhodobacter marinus]PWE26721.1 hypothetical protein C4N9_20905 [Pararhodobacter marinus]
MAKQDDYTRYTIRLPTPLYERVKEAAGEASVNSLIVQVLEERYPAPDEDFERLIALLEQAQRLRGGARTDKQREVYDLVIKRVSDEIEKVLFPPPPSDD